MKASLISNFADKLTSPTILNNILTIQNIKNPQQFFDIIKNKFNDFEMKIFTAEADNAKSL